MNIELGGGRRKPVNEEGGKRSCIDVFMVYNRGTW
jgi:hypothetical protein